MELLRGLGGQNSGRLLLGGLLADLFAEHYNWVASCDRASPDATTVQTRADAFLGRPHVLFNKSLILTDACRNTFTGVTLQFLNETHDYQVGAGVQMVGIGDWNTDQKARNTVKGCISLVQQVVANMKEYMKLYRPQHSWLQAFTAFRLPSALGAGSQHPPELRAQDTARLQRICREAQLPETQALRELSRLIPRAEKFHREGCQANVAWARASAEWPELATGRRLVELALIW